MTMLKTPTRAIRRMKATLYDANGTVWTTASAIGPPYDFEVPDTTVAVVYAACDNADCAIGFWVWEGEKWVDLHNNEVIETCNRLCKSVAPKPTPVVIDCKLYRLAEDFAADYAAEVSGPPSTPTQGLQKPKVKKVQK